MQTALLHRSKHLWLLVSTLLVLVQPAAWAEGNTRKVGIVTILSVEAASRSPVFKLLTDAIRASVPGLDITFEWRSADGKNDRYPQIVTDLVQQQVDVIIAGSGQSEGVTGLVFAPDRGSQVRIRLGAGGKWIRTLGPR
jgi:ABC-type uncharacterized transport system substrate-binding protein